jgi:hypothetical protein
VLLLVDGSLDDGGVVGVGNQTDDNAVLANLVLEGSRVVDIERDGAAVLEALTELLGRLEGTAGWNGMSMTVVYGTMRRRCVDTNSDRDVGVAQDLSSRAGDETSSKKESLPVAELACVHSLTRAVRPELEILTWSFRETAA